MDDKSVISIIQRLSSIETTISHSSKELEEIKKEMNDLAPMRYDIKKLMDDHEDRKQQWVWIKRGLIGALITAIWGLYDKIKGGF